MIISVISFKDYFAAGKEGELKTFIPKGIKTTNGYLLGDILDGIEYFGYSFAINTHRKYKINKTLQEYFRG